MSLNRTIIGKALDEAGVTGEQREKAEDNLIRAVAPERPRIEPWKFPKFTLPPKK